MRSTPLLSAPIGDIAEMLLKELWRPLIVGGLKLETSEVAAYGEAIAARAPLPATADALITALRQLIHNGEATLLARFGLAFATSLSLDAPDLIGWQTTAELLEIANTKLTAEAHITLASALLALLGEPDGARNLRAVVVADNGVWDVEACLAKRALCHLYGIAPDTPHWQDLLPA